MPKNEVPLLTKEMASDCGYCVAHRAFDPTEFGAELDALSAIASGTAVCVEAERLARMEAALTKIAAYGRKNPGHGYDCATFALAALAPTGEKP